MKKLLALVLPWLLAAGVAYAQPNPPNPPPTSYAPPSATAPVSLAVSNTSARVGLTALPAAYPAVDVINDTTVPVYCNLGTITVTASTTVYQLYVPAGGHRATWDAVSTYVACITASGSGTVHITQTNGAPQLGFLSGGGSGGGAVGSVNGSSSNIVCNPPTGSVLCGATYPNNAQTGTTYTLVASDGGSIVTDNNASAATFTLPSSTATNFTAGFSTDIQSIGAGAMSFTSASSFVLPAPTLAQGQMVSFASLGSGGWLPTGISLPYMGADTVLGNFSASAGWPAATAMPACANDGSHALVYASHLFACASVTGGGGGSLTITDGTHTVASTTQITVTGGTVGGTSPNATLTITGGSGSGTVNTGTAGDGSYYATSTNAVSDAATAQTVFGGLTAVNAGAASSSPVLISGALFTGGSATTTFPLIEIKAPGTTAASTYSTSGTYLDINAVSGFGGNLETFRVGGAASVWSVAFDGSVASSGSITLGATKLFNWTGRGFLTSPAAGQVQFGSSQAAAPVAQTVSVQGVVTATSNTAGALWTFKDSVGTGTGASGGYQFDVASAGSTGSTPNTEVAALTIDSTLRTSFKGVAQLFGYTVSTLPASPGTGATAYVTDALTCTFLGSLTGSGSTFCPVVYNGSSWVAH